MNDNQPGQLITPQGPDTPTPPPPVPGQPLPDHGPQVPDPAPAPIAQPEQAAPAFTAPAATTVPQPEVPSWDYLQEESAVMPLTTHMEDISWTAAEFIERQKKGGWYVSVLLVGLVITLLVYIISRDKISTGIVALVMIGFVIYAARKPQMQQYRLSYLGVEVGTKAYSFQEFKTFSIAEEGSIVSIVFMPLRRFMPPLTIYVAPTQEERVINFLSTFLPFEQHRLDVVDSLMRRIRF